MRQSCNARRSAEAAYAGVSLPLKFRLPLQARSIQPGTTYRVSARIETGGRIIMQSQPQPALTRGARSSGIKLVLRR